MTDSPEILSIWRSALDQVALAQAQVLAKGQPRASITYGEDFSAMTIFNFGCYVEENPTSYNAALTQMFQAMRAASQNAIGGLAFIPQQSFALVPSNGGFPFMPPDQSVIVGSGSGGGPPPGGGAAGFFHFVVTPQGSGQTVFLNIPKGVPHTAGGIYFRGLSFKWMTSSNNTDNCIYAGLRNVRAIGCTFTDCPTAFNAQDVSCCMEQCTINYTVSSAGPNDTRAVVLSGPQCAVYGPGVFSQTSQAPSSNGATGCAAISIEGAEHAIISNMQLYEWTFGIDFSHGGGNVVSTNITNCDIECWQNAIKLQLSGTNNSAAATKITSCLLAKASDSTDDDAVVKINAHGGVLYDVAFLDCTVVNLATAPAGQDGVDIVSGSVIKIIGGTYSNNGRAGVAFTGSSTDSVTDVQIIGANLQPAYAGAANQNKQQYALMFDAATPVSGMLVSGCDMTGYAPGNPVYFAPGSAAPLDLLIVDCPGYNDQNTPLNGNIAPTSPVGAAGCSTPYFGPSVIAFSSPFLATITVFGQTITTAMAIIFLPSPYDQFSFQVVPQHFSWTGH